MGKGKGQGRRGGERRTRLRTAAAWQALNVQHPTSKAEKILQKETPKAFASRRRERRMITTVNRIAFQIRKHQRPVRGMS
jgi:hypothetical protein